jgi:tetratricopeptide (TPR) repeat protein
LTRLGARNRLLWGGSMRKPIILPSIALGFFAAVRVVLFAGAFVSVMVLSASFSTRAFADEDHHHEAPTQEQLGTVHFPVSCNADAQKSFEHGVALLHSFWYEESEKRFAEAAKQDSTCAMAYWGEAMSLWHQLWDEPNAETVRKGAAELKQGEKAQPKTDRERDYLRALEAFYSTSPKASHHDRAVAYCEAMKTVYEKYPDDHEAAAFYALSLLASEPEDDTTFANRKQAGAILEKLFEEEPNHPGVAHYLIHTYDKPQLAELGLPAARQYAQIAPSAPHAVHMPSHIFARVGDWPDSIQSNLASIAATRKATKMHLGGEGHQFHAMDFLIYAYLQSGREADATKVIDEVKSMPPMHMGGMDRDMQAFAMSKFSAMYFIELHRWQEAGALPVVSKAAAVDRAYTYWAKTIGRARSGDLAGAKQDLAEMASIHQDYVDEKKTSTAEYVEMLRQEASAWVLHREGKDEEATSVLRKAADHEDAVGEEQTSMPAREMLADMLLEMKRPDQALAEYEGDLKFNPKRFDGLYGAAQAAEIAGQASKSNQYYSTLIKTCDGSNSMRPELAKAKQSVVARK